MYSQKFRLELTPNQWLEISFDNRDIERKSVFSILCRSNNDVAFGFVMNDEQFEKLKEIIEIIELKTKKKIN